MTDTASRPAAEAPAFDGIASAVHAALPGWAPLPNLEPHFCKEVPGGWLVGGVFRGTSYVKHTGMAPDSRETPNDPIEAAKWLNTHARQMTVSEASAKPTPRPPTDDDRYSFEPLRGVTATPSSAPAAATAQAGAAGTLIERDELARRVRDLTTDITLQRQDRVAAIEARIGDSNEEFQRLYSRGAALGESDVDRMNEVQRELGRLTGLKFSVEKYAASLRAGLDGKTLSQLAHFDPAFGWPNMEAQQ